MDSPAVAAQFDEAGKPEWLVFRYSPAAMFSLKMSRATSTAGKTLLTPTLYAAKMAFVDAALRHRVTSDADALVRGLAKAQLRIGVPQHACVTGTIQKVRQESREAERNPNKQLPPYRGNIAMRELVHFQGDMRLAFKLDTCAPELTALLEQTAPAINYFGKRGGFVQFRDSVRIIELDSTFTQPADGGSREPLWEQRTTLDDFGPKATFDVLNSFSAKIVKPGLHRIFVETAVPFHLYNAGPGFVHYSAPGVML
jgi:hypothetical protein